MYCNDSLFLVIGINDSLLCNLMISVFVVRCLILRYFYCFFLELFQVNDAVKIKYIVA